MGGEWECLLTSIASITASNIYPNSRLHLSKTEKNYNLLGLNKNQAPFIVFALFIVKTMELYGKVSEKRLMLFGRNGATQKEK